MAKTITPSIWRAPRGRAGSHGFALVTTLWTLGLIAVLVTILIAGARYRAKDVSTTLATTRVAVAADSGITLALALILGEPATKLPPIRCVMPDATDVFIAVDNEAGKVDLNTADRELLVRLFAALSRDAKVGQRIADSLMRRRPAAPSQATPAPALSGSNSPGLGVLVSTLQLDQVVEMPPALFRAALPFVTVKSGRPNLQVDAASPKLRRLLGLTEQSNAATAQVAAAGNPSFTIRADAATADGARFIREALVSLTGDAARPYMIHEWRHGDLDDASEPVHSGKRSRDCLRMRDADPKVVRYWN